MARLSRAAYSTCAIIAKNKTKKQTTDLHSLVLEIPTSVAFRVYLGSLLRNSIVFLWVLRSKCVQQS